MSELRLVIVLCAAALAGCGGEDEAARSQPEPATTTTTTNAAPDAPAGLPFDLPPPQLRPGLITTVEPFEPTIVFRVPEGWNGSQDDVSFGIGRGVDLEAEDFDRSSIYVYRLTEPFSKATAALEDLPGLRVTAKRPARRVFGYPGRTYDVTVRGASVTLEPLGIFDELGHGRARITIYNVRGTALKVDIRGDTETDLAEAERVLRSFEFPR